MIHRDNYQLVKEHLRYLEEVHQLSVESITRYWFYLRHLLLWADDIPFARVDSLRPTFPAYVSSLQARQGDGYLASISQKKIIETAKRFFQWAKSTYPKEFRGLPAGWIDLLRPPRQAPPSKEHEYVSLDEIKQLVHFKVPDGDLALKRDQAAATLLFLSGMRASAFVSLPIQAIDLESRSIKQWPELGVKTKNRKRATTFLLPIPELFQLVADWDALVRSTLPITAPWYAPVGTSWGEQIISHEDPGNNRHHALDKRLKLLFSRAGLPYHSAHKFRHGHAVYGLQHAQTMADYKALSMNLMHEDIKITDQIYAPILSDEIRQRVARLTVQPADQPKEDLAALIWSINPSQLPEALKIIAERLSL